MRLWLVLDIGNTHTVAAVYDSTARISTDLKPLTRVRFRTDSQATSDEYRVLLAQLFETQGGQAPSPVGRFWSSVERVVVSTVVPPLEPVVVEACRPAPCVSIHHRAKRDFELAIPVPESLGADRLANLAGAMSLVKPPFLIVDAGTATKFCMVDESGRYIGGAITPGFEISWKALQSRAAKLFWVDLVRPETSIGDTTETQLRSGVLLGYESLIEGMTDRLLGDAQAIGSFKDPALLSTGGCMRSLELSARFRHVPDLTLLGLLRYGQLNS